MLFPPPSRIPKTPPAPKLENTREIYSAKNIFGLSGYVKSDKLKKSLIKSYSQTKKIPHWKINPSKQAEIWHNFFPGQESKLSFKKEDIVRALKGLHQERVFAKYGQRKEIQDKIKILKKSVGL